MICTYVTMFIVFEHGFQPSCFTPLNIFRRRSTVVVEEQHALFTRGKSVPKASRPTQNHPKSVSCKFLSQLCLTMTSPTYGTSSPKLTLTQRLVPPMKSVGQGANALRYASQSPAWSADFSRDGQWLAACYGSPDPCVRMWKLSDDGKRWTLHSTLDSVHTRTIRSVAFCPLAKTYILAAASFDASVSIWELSNGEWECTTQLEGHDHEIKAVTWNSTGSLLATCGRDKT